MNEIFIILNNSCSFVKLIFENFKNEFVFFDKHYNFEFLNINKLRIFNSDETYILETIDSFIYTDQTANLLIYKLITLNHNEWFDQALLDFNTKKIIRIKDRNQFGEFNLENNILKVDWDYWGSEKFIKYDENIFNHESLIVNNDDNDILVFMHMCNLNDGFSIFEKQLKKIKKCKIYECIKKIYVCWLGEYEERNITNNKIEIINLGKNIKYYEFLTINKIKEIIDKDSKDYKILYLHNKGTRKAGNEDVIKSWRNMMEYFLIEQALYCYINLNHFDTIGCNVINQGENNYSNVNNKHNLHYSGNFWWSRSSYIKTLNLLKVDNENMEEKRFQCENWILSKIENRNIGIIYQNNTNIHPYHRYIFEDYKNKKLHIKKLKINLK